MLERSDATISRRSLLVSSLAAALAPAMLVPADALGLGMGFLAVGDWGKREKGPRGARTVAAAMGRWAEAFGPRAVISTGDNFYESGVQSVDDPLWRSRYEEIYVSPALMCPWYAILGNHDHAGNIDAEIAYTGKSSRWHMPARYYSRSETLPDGGRADFFFIDTTPIFDATDGILQRIRPFDAFSAAQFTWFEERLAASAADWKIVVGHHPVFSGGMHGSTAGLIRHLKPLLDRYGVHAYLNGHDHDLQHIIVDGIHYITSGAGGEARRTGAIAGTQFAEASLGFLAATLTKTTLSFAFVSDDDRIIYENKVAASSG